MKKTVPHAVALLLAGSVSWSWCAAAQAQPAPLPGCATVQTERVPDGHAQRARACTVDLGSGTLGLFETKTVSGYCPKDWSISDHQYHSGIQFRIPHGVQIVYRNGHPDAKIERASHHGALGVRGSITNWGMTVLSLDRIHLHCVR
ncbi:hypothetical protein [Streptomyces sp. NPDC089919]|uniref:hypothetical protein n=1 Tax=Streptomyces sp. NPDC089919 TaxID=3155188 RepID=UPI0034163AD9